VLADTSFWSVHIIFSLLCGAQKRLALHLKSKARFGFETESKLSFSARAVWQTNHESVGLPFD